MSNIQKRLLELYHKPFDYKFTDDEINFIIEHSDIKEGLVNYAIWKQQRQNNKYIFFHFDFNPYRQRKSGIDNSIDVISTRSLTEAEKRWEAGNYGSRNRIIRGWNYKTIEEVINEEAPDAKTPEKFVKHCKRLGYSNPNYQYSEQLNLF
jgi:hypothetical protein